MEGHGPPRQREDLDIKIRAPVHDRDGEERRRIQIAALGRTFTRAGGTKWPHTEKSQQESSWSQTWSFNQKGAGKIDLVELHQSTPWAPEPGRIEDVELLLEPTASILFGKMWRSHLALARDAFDLGVARELDPRALTEALLVLGKRRTKQTLEHFRTAERQLEVEGQTELKGVAEMWEDMARSAGRAATRAIERRWHETENQQRKTMADESEATARRIRLIQLERGTGEITVPGHRYAEHRRKRKYSKSNKRWKKPWHRNGQGCTRGCGRDRTSIAVEIRKNYPTPAQTASSVPANCQWKPAPPERECAQPT